MASSAPKLQELERAFQRHSRPQIPAVQTAPLSSAARSSKILSVRSSRSWDPPLRPVRDRSKQAKWVDFASLGKLTQAEVDLFVYVRRRSPSTLAMFKRLDVKDDRVWKRLVALEHSNLLAVKYVIEDAVDSRSIGFEYVRYNLEEIWSVHMPMEELHVRAIAQPVRNPSNAPRCTADV